ncbi:LysR family transcriptional regulator [Ornithobacterium rhinotracheale]|uniref:LysR family transcriptional regulator n=1 Tax=Ornithobacterium rhinotracheale TaxID=28251 RepID=UPI00129CF781|nr:LysR family transcriptional regulator [Ornithobacterium rhinotracheale]MRI62454.1 LysR family transcriptional regulator [Ornithobacterium rhinotracheale]
MIHHKYIIFKEVALKKSFSAAAHALHLSQSAVSKNIKNLESTLSSPLFLREGNKIKLTPKAEKLLKYVFEIEKIELKINDEFSNQKTKITELKFGASTTLANYIIPFVFQDLMKFKNIQKINFCSGNSSQIEAQVLAHEMDFALVENIGKNTQLQYIPFVEDEIVLVCRKTLKIKEEIGIEQLQKLPFISREYGSGTQKVIETALTKKGIKNLNTVAVYDSTEGIKTILKNSDYFAFLSIHAVREEVLNQELKIIEIQDFSINRMFHFILRQGFNSQYLNTLMQKINQAYYKNA